MGWRDNLHLEGRGSFRDVEFLVNGVTSTVGRRTVIHTFPGRDFPSTEDNGMKPKAFGLEAFVIGEDYMEQRDALREAFETEGPAPLVHPYWGKFTVVVVGDVRIQETTAEGGMARFTLNVVEAEEAPPIVEKQDTEKEVEEEAEKATEAVKEQADEDLDAGPPNIAEIIQAAINTVTAAVAVVNTVKGKVNAVMNKIDEIAEAIEAVADAVAALVAFPGQLVDAVTDAVGAVMDAVGSIGDAFDSYFDDDETPGDVAGNPLSAALGSTPASGDKRLEALMVAFREIFAYGDDFTELSTLTPTLRTTANNRDAIVVVFKSVAVIQAARVAATMPISSATLAISTRNELFEAIDELLEDANDTVYGALVDLRAAISRHFTQVSEQLPQVSTFTPKKTLPALVIAQMVHGDAKRDAEIIDRNNIKNPAKVPGDEALEILFDS